MPVVLVTVINHLIYMHLSNSIYMFNKWIIRVLIWAPSWSLLTIRRVILWMGIMWHGTLTQTWLSRSRLWCKNALEACDRIALVTSQIFQCWPVQLEIYFWFKCDLGQNYYTPQVQPDWGSNSWPPDRDSTLHVTEIPALTTRPSVSSVRNIVSLNSKLIILFALWNIMNDQEGMGH